ncbi:DUF397 domain-containing protein [Nocardiopsis coralliicola]
MPHWRTSSYSGGGECVEIGDLPNGTQMLRDSKHPQFRQDRADRR